MRGGRETPDDCDACGVAARDQSPAADEIKGALSALHGFGRQAVIKRRQKATVSHRQGQQVAIRHLPRGQYLYDINMFDRNQN